MMGVKSRPQRPRPFTASLCRLQWCYYLSVLLAVCQLPTQALGSLCDSLLPDNTWDALTAAIEASPSFLMLCPFEISGAGCPATPGLGIVVPKDSSLTIMCERNVFGVAATTTTNSNTAEPACVIDCPGNHFTIVNNATLTLDGITLRGSLTSSSIYMQATAELQAFDSTFENNYNPSGNGGAIHAGESTRMFLHQCDFTNNTALNGGAVYTEGTSQMSNSNFLENQSTSTTTTMAGGGAIAIGVFAETTIADCYFDGNEAKSTVGAAILDHSNGLSTQSTANTGCYNYDADMGTSSNQSSSSCNGIERSAAIAEIPCREFEASCVTTARESSTPTPTEPPSTILPTTSPSLEPTVDPSIRPSSTPQTPPPSTDPCLDDDTEAFDCILQELLEGETPSKQEGIP